MTSASDELELPADQRPAAKPSAEVDQDSVGDVADAARGPLIAPMMARATIGIVFAGICAIALIFVISAGTSPQLTALSIGYLLVLLAIQVLYFSRPGTDLHSPLSYGLLGAQAALVYLPLLFQYKQSWIGLLSFVAGTVLLVLPRVLAWIAYAAVVASAALIQESLNHSKLDILFIALATVVFGLEVYGLTRLARFITELHAARTELANAAVAHERLRFARDLHDLLGLSLSAIAPKGELARRLVPKKPERARHELSEMLDIARRALADVRAVAHGYRDLNLDEESRTAESVLAASRVDVRMEFNHGELPVQIRTLLAAVLREGVANVLEHSEAERCDIVMQQVGGTVSLDIVNDGVGESAETELRGGSGLAHLSDRVARYGGELGVGRDPDGRFHLRLTLPVARGEVEQSTDDEGEQAPRTATQLAWALVGVVYVGLSVLAGLHFIYLSDDTFEIVVTYGFISLLLLIQLYFTRPGTQLRSPTSYALLMVQACLVYLPLLQFGLSWLALPGFLAGSALLVLPPVAAWPVFVAIAASAGWVQAISNGMALEIVYSTTNVVITGAVVYGLTWMAGSVSELRTARIQLAKVAVAEERLRFARDLHDLLGLSLSAITLKSELAHRLVTVAPEKATEELTDVLNISRLALADVRLVASGYRELSLSEEFRTAESLLAAAEVDVEMRVNHGDLPIQVGTLLATVLREGVTNVLRHSKGERCEITMQRRDRMVCLDIVNDGVTHSLTKNNGGSGIHNLSYRVAMLGGELTAGLEPDGRFWLRARVPA